MILFSLFWEFLKIGLFSFGGAYGAIPLIKETVLARGWADEEMFSHMIAVSESTPGPIMVNTATYIGTTQAGVPGAFLATLGVVLPSFFIILLVSILLKNWIKSRGVQAVLRGIKPCLIGVILATGVYMAMTATIGKLRKPSLSLTSCMILLILIALTAIPKLLHKKELSPIQIILLSAVLGIALY